MAKVSLTLSPAQFDLVRETILDRRDASNTRAKDKKLDAATRSKYRQQAIELETLNKFVNGGYA